LAGMVTIGKSDRRSHWRTNNDFRGSRDCAVRSRRPVELGLGHLEGRSKQDVHRRALMAMIPYSRSFALRGKNNHQTTTSANLARRAPCRHEPCTRRDRAHRRPPAQCAAAARRASIAEPVKSLDFSHKIAWDATMAHDPLSRAPHFLISQKVRAPRRPAPR
jgi:hypothetical protein